MIHFVVGPANSGKTTYLLNKINELSRNRLINNDILILLPSFESLDNFLTDNGDEVFPGIEIETFRTFSNKIISNSDTKLERLELGNSFLLEHALEKVLSNKDYIKYHEFIRNWRNTTSKSAIRNAITDLIRENVGSHKLIRIADETNDNEIHTISMALAVILENYLKVIHQNNFYDESESEGITAKILKKETSKCKHVFVDCFNRFTQGQIQILKTLGITSEIFIAIDTIIDSESYFVNYPNIMLQQLKNAFEKTTKSEVINVASKNNDQESRFDSFQKSFLSNEVVIDDHDIRILNGESPYDEIARVGNEIRNLIDNNQCSFNDISVLFRSSDPYSDIIPFIFTKLSIPFKIPQLKSLRTSQIIKYVLDFEIILNQYTEFYDVIFSENTLLQLSSFLTNELTLSLLNDRRFNSFDFIKLNDNLIESGLHSFRLLSDAIKTKHDDDSYVATRRKIFNQCELDLLSNIMKLFDEYSKVKDFALSLLETQLKNQKTGHLNTIIQNLITTYEKINAVKNIPFINYLKEVSNEVIIPKHQNNSGVICGNVASLQLKNSIHTVFIVGLNQNKFPVNKSPSPIISDNFRNYLWNNHQIDLHHTFHEFEDYLFYKSINKSTKTLYLSYSAKNLQGTAQNPSTYLYHNAFNNLLNMFTNEIPIDKINFPGSYDRLFLRYKNNDTKHNNDIYKYLSFIDEKESIKFLRERSKLTLLKDVVKYKQYSISKLDKTYLQLSSFTNKVISKLIGNEDLIFSHSSLKNYLTCPYKFLVETIYKIKEKQRFKLDAGDWGNLFHNSMEFFAYQIVEFLQSNTISRLTDFKLTLIDNVIKDLRDKFHKGYLIYEKKLKIRELEKHIDKFRKFLDMEIDRRVYQSASPAAVELAFGIPFSEKTKTPIVIDKILSKHNDFLEISTNEHKIKIRGFIDLIDEIEIDNEKYFLIIDYKKVSDFSKYEKIIGWMKYETLEDKWVKDNLDNNILIPILNFRYFDLQIPIYLLAINKVFNLKNANSGLFYHLFESGLTGFIEEDIVNKLPKDYFDVKPFTKVNTTFTNNEIEQLLKSSEEYIRNIIENMKSGIFPISPDISHPSRNRPCDYCPFTSVCRINSN